MSYRQPFKGEYPITQKYGEIIPGVTVYGKPHTGIDYGCPQGTPILASNDGVIMDAGWDLTGFGFRVIILHDDGKATLYGHLDSISVDRNENVKQGQEIGISGATGKVTGAHLHFEARERWNDYTSHFDPMELPLMSFADVAENATTQEQEQNIDIPENLSEHRPLKSAECFAAGDLLRVQNLLGVKAFHDTGFSYARMSAYPQGTPFYFTGDMAKRKDNGLTYMRVVPALFSVWIAVNDGETQLLDK